MKLKRLEEQRAELLIQIEKENNSETRSTEKIEQLCEDLDFVDFQISKEKELADKMLEGNKGDKMELRTLKNVVLADEKLEKRNYKDNNDLELGKLVRAMLGKEERNSKEAVYTRQMMSADNKMVIPQKLADYIVDYARNNSAIFGKIPTLQMESNNLKVAKQTKDVEAHFVKEGDLIPASDVAFESVDLEGKTLALFVPISEQLLDSANLSQVLVDSCSKAIATALDKALLYGEGDNLDNAHMIKGLLTYDGINQLEHQVVNDTIDYDGVITGIAPIKRANLNPTDIAYSSIIANELAMYKSGEGEYLHQPMILNQFDITESNNVGDDHIVIYDRNSLLLGIHKDITVEWGTSGDQFQRIMKGLRIYLRCDMKPINESGTTLVTIVE